jgi:hypothetical protein
MRNRRDQRAAFSLGTAFWATAFAAMGLAWFVDHRSRDHKLRFARAEAKIEASSADKTAKLFNEYQEKHWQATRLSSDQLLHELIQCKRRLLECEEKSKIPASDSTESPNGE